MENKQAPKLSKRERDVMEVLWDTDKPMIASDIARANDELSINTVNVVLKGLLKRELIEVSEIVYSGTVLTRSYRPMLSATDYAYSFIRRFHKGENSPLCALVSDFLDHEEDSRAAAEELIQMLQARLS